MKRTTLGCDRAAKLLAVQCLALLFAACGGSEEAPPAKGPNDGAVIIPQNPGAAGTGSSAVGTSPSSAAGSVAPAPTPTPPVTQPPVARPTPTPTPTPVPMPPGAIPMPPAGGTPPPAAPGGAPPPAAAPGPDDGDPSKPIVAIDGLPCKASGGIRGLSGANFKVDDRDLIMSYPCNKHEGAPMTFILNLHGTTPVEQHFYQEGYFAASKYAASHNLIVATPSSVVQQWGNGDGGKDLPYLMNVIDWVYKNLGTKFDIRSMWVGGHSWGAMYTSTFACKPELADKVRGIIIMSGLPTQPACASKMSVIDTNAEMDIAQPLNQASIPMQHGCKDPVMMMLGNNTQTLWPECNKGFVHSNYLMLGKMHADFMDDVVVKSIVDLIKSVRP